MRKIDKNFCAWMMAGALAVGTLSGGWTAPAQAWACLLYTSDAADEL